MDNQFLRAGNPPADCPKPHFPGKLIFRACAFAPQCGSRQDAAWMGAQGRQSSGFWRLSMAQVCDICGKGPQFGNNISHAHNVTKRRWNVNLHPVRAKVGGGNKRLRVCSSCLKAGKVVKA